MLGHETLLTSNFYHDDYVMQNILLFSVIENILKLLISYHFHLGTYRTPGDS